jgi:hypothetical protein
MSDLSIAALEHLRPHAFIERLLGRRACGTEKHNQSNQAGLHARTDRLIEQRRTLRRCTVEGESLY